MPGNKFSLSDKVIEKTTCNVYNPYAIPSNTSSWFTRLKNTRRYLTLEINMYN